MGRFLSVDPLTSSYPWYTPYQFAGNKPIAAIDIDGLEEWVAIFNGDGSLFGFVYDEKLTPLPHGQIYQTVVSSSESAINQVWPYVINASSSTNFAFIPSESLVGEDKSHATKRTLWKSAYDIDASYFKNLDQSSDNFISFQGQDLPDLVFKAVRYSIEHNTLLGDGIIDFHGTNNNPDYKDHKLMFGTTKIFENSQESYEVNAKYFKLLAKFRVDNSSTLLGHCNANQCPQILENMAVDGNTTIYAHKSYSYSDNLENGRFYGGNISWLRKSGREQQGLYEKVAPDGSVTHTFGVEWGTKPENAGKLRETKK